MCPSAAAAAAPAVAGITATSVIGAIALASDKTCPVKCPPPH